MQRIPVLASLKSKRCHLIQSEITTRKWQLNLINMRAIKILRKYSDQNKSLSKEEILTASTNPNSTPSTSHGHNSTLCKISDQATSSPLHPRIDGSISNIPRIMDSSLGADPLKEITVRKSRKIFRKFVISVTLIGVFAFVGGVFYSRINENFHDFFTEYVPFGERIVLFLEEMEYKKKFPESSDSNSRNTENLISIPRNSGVSWRIVNGQKSGSTSRYTDATSPDLGLTKSSSQEETKLDESTLKDSTVTASSLPDKNPSQIPSSAVEKDAVSSEYLKTSNSPESVHFISPEVDQPSRFPPESYRIDPITLNQRNEPIVQDLVKIINNIITVVEADNSNIKFSSTIEKVKTEVSDINSRILALKEQALKEADAKIQAEKDDFDRAAKELIRRVELEMQNQQASWQEEFQAEREKIQKTYEERLSTELQHAKELHELHLRNELVNQAIEMKKNFSQEVKDRVEEERNGRLKKLSELSNTVAELEKLTTNCNSVVDFNLNTQKLHVAVEATRALLEQSEKPQPFLRELLALREIASDDPVVNAAIASINPTTYHQGIPSSAWIIDRFRRVSNEVRKAALLPADAGVASHASSYILSKLLFRKKGLAMGDDVESILSRAETFLEEGDLDAAAREVNGLKGWAKILSQDWLDEVRSVLEVRQALDANSNEIIATQARLKSLTID